MGINFDQLPIPDWGLGCPKCRYPLKGLPRHRCPECGSEFDIHALIRPWTRLRPPRLTGDELPFPDFGLGCRSCGGALAGTTAYACPHCAAPFAPEDFRPKRDWFVLDAELCDPLPVPGVQALLAAEHVPYIPAEERTITEIYAGGRPMQARLRAPREFYFEILFLLQQAKGEMEWVRAGGRSPRWPCAACGEKNPGHFDICWNCLRERPDEWQSDPTGGWSGPDG